LRGKVYRRKLLNPRRFKGITSFIASYGIYSYLPYIAVYTGGSTIPILAACAAGFYGMLAFGESRIVNSIEVINGGANAGKLRVNVSSSILASHYIIVDIRDIHSVVSLGNNDLGDEDNENNII
jgi:hypothetical protein